MHQCTNAPTDQCTNAPMHQCTNGPMHKCTNAPMHQCTNAPMSGRRPWSEGAGARRGAWSVLQLRAPGQHSGAASRGSPLHQSHHAALRRLGSRGRRSVRHVSAGDSPRRRGRLTVVPQLRARLDTSVCHAAPSTSDRAYKPRAFATCV